MKKALFLFAFATLLFSCQRDNTLTVTTSEFDNSKTSSRGPCDDITIQNGDGLGLCGVAVGTSDCDLCGSLSRDIAIVGSPATYTLDGQGAFVLYNFGTTDVTVTVFFNCAGTAVNILVPADSKVFYKIDVDNQGCCFATPNSGPC